MEIIEVSEDREQIGVILTKKEIALFLEYHKAGSNTTSTFVWKKYECSDDSDRADNYFLYHTLKRAAESINLPDNNPINYLHIDTIPPPS